MSRVMTWRERSWRHVREAITQGEAQGLEGADLEKFVRANYPFGIREHWPYKVWCDVVNQAFRNWEARRRKAEENANPNQGSLF